MSKVLQRLLPAVQLGICLILSATAAGELASTGDQTPAYTSGQVSNQRTQNLFVDEVLQHIQEEQIYLRQLGNIRKAVEEELEIVRLIRQCDHLDAVCTGKGVSVKAMTEPVPVKPVQTEPPSPPPSPAAASAGPLPELIRILDKTASMRYQGRQIQVKAGENIGPYTVSAVYVDGVELRHAGQRYRLLLDWALLLQNNRRGTR